MTTSAELRAELCDLYAERSRREKRMLEIVRAGDLTGLNPEYLNSMDFGIADLERQIAELEAATPVDQRIKDAELLVSAALVYSEGVRSRHADALAEVAEADADLERAVEAAKQVIAKVAEEQPDLRGKVGETGCFQIARGITYKHLIMAVSLDVVRKMRRDAAQDFDVEAEQEAENALSIKPAFVTKHRRMFEHLVEEQPTVTIKFVKSAFNPERN